MGDTIARFPIRFEPWYRPLGVPIRLRELFVSVEDPQAAAAALRPA